MTRIRSASRALAALLLVGGVSVIGASVAGADMTTVPTTKFTPNSSMQTVVTSTSSEATTTTLGDGTSSTTTVATTTTAAPATTAGQAPAAKPTTAKPAFTGASSDLLALGGALALAAGSAVLVGTRRRSEEG